MFGIATLNIAKNVRNCNSEHSSPELFGSAIQNNFEVIFAMFEIAISNFGTWCLQLKTDQPMRFFRKFGIAIPNIFCVVRNCNSEHLSAMFGICANLFEIHPPGSPFGGFSCGIRLHYLVRFGLLCVGMARVPKFWCETAAICSLLSKSGRPCFLKTRKFSAGGGGRNLIA